MKSTKNVDCEYLGKDQRSCTSVDDVTGQAGRDKDCSADSKDLCCYLCDKKGTCQISCSFLDETKDDENAKDKLMRSVASADGSRSVFLCPFCGAPYRKTIPAGAVQVRCDYCGASIAVPSDIGGKGTRCPNHPDSLAAGVCNQCGESFCDNCLLAVKSGQQLLCPKCYEEYKSSTRSMLLAAAVVLPVILIGFSVLFWINLGTTYVASSARFQLLLFGVIGVLIFIGAVAVAQWFGKQNPVSLHDMRAEQASEGDDENE